MWKTALQIMKGFMTTPHRCKHDSAAFILQLEVNIWTEVYKNWEKKVKRKIIWKLKSPLIIVVCWVKGDLTLASLQKLMIPLHSRQSTYLISAKQQQNDGVRLDWTQVLMESREKSEWPIKIGIYHSLQARKRILKLQQKYEKKVLSQNDRPRH